MNSTLNFSKSISDENSVSTTIHHFVICLGVLAIMSNLIGLIITKFVSGGSSPVLILMRNLFVMDSVIALYGIFKSFVLQNKDSLYINCFLPESLFIAASVGSIFFALWMNRDLCSRLTRSWTHGRKNHKGNVNLAIMFIWNVSLIFGFIPIMGWNDSDDLDNCNLFAFYSNSYLSIVASFWTLAIVCCVLSMIISYKCVKKLDSTMNLFHQSILALSRHKKMITSVQFELGTLCIWYSSCIVTVIVLSDSTNGENNMWTGKNDSVLLYCAISFQVRSFINSVTRMFIMSQMKYKPNVKRQWSKNRQQWSKRKLALQKTFSINSATSSIKRKFKERRDPRVFAVFGTLKQQPSVSTATQDLDFSRCSTPSQISLDFSTKTMLHGSVTSLRLMRV